MPLLSNNTATFDSVGAKLEILSSLVKTSKVYAPIVQNHMTMKSETGSRIEWADQNLGNGSVVLNGAYTAGAGSVVIDASSLVAPYSIKTGVHQLQVPNNSAIYNITAYDSATNTLTITLDQGTDASLSDNTELWLIRNGEIGEDAGSQNDVAYATSDYNYLSNFSFVIRISNMNENGQLLYHFDEITFENQLQNNVPEAIRTLERRTVKDYRVQGTGAAGRNGNAVQSGNGSRAGGIITLANARGLYTASTGSAALSEDILETDMINLRQRGAFTTLSERTRDMGMSYCKVYCNEITLGDLNKLTRIQRAPEAFYAQSDKIGGKGGTFTNAICVNGVILEFLPSDAMANNEILYVPQDDLIELRVVRMLEEQPKIERGDNSIKMFSVTYTTVVKSPWLLGHRSNLVRL
tara:strand:+ start:948 stop:2174 length:1227 start_codon:yes stop_codon:yes gene_type:complete